MGAACGDFHAVQRALEEYLKDGGGDPVFPTQPISINMTTPAQAPAQTPAPTLNFDNIQGDVL